MIRVYWCAPEEHGGVPVQLAAVGDCDLSVMRVGDEWHWLVQRDGRDVAEGRAETALADKQLSAATDVAKATRWAMWAAFAAAFGAIIQAMVAVASFYR